jgi:putative MATE family efflux protein
MSIGFGLNAILDPFLIGGFGPFPHLGLNGAACATLISQATALTIGFVYLNRKNHLVAFNPKKFIIDRRITLLVFVIGFPAIIQQSLVSLGNMFITTFVNSFGSAATNAFGAVGRVDMLVFMPAMSMSMAVSALTGQNLGARKPERIKDIFKWGIMTTSSITIPISFIAVFLSKIILIMFGLGNDPAVMQIGTNYLRIVGSCYIFLAVMLISNGIINGSGHTIITMIFAILSLWIIRVPFSWLLSKTSLGITGIWIAVSLSFVVMMIVSLTYYSSGKWKRSVIMKTPSAVPYGEQIS